LARVVDTIVRATTGSYCGVACHDVSVFDRVACHDAFLGGTVDVTTGPVLHVIDTVGVTTGSCLAILRCNATMLVLGDDIMGKTTDLFGCIMSLYSLWRWAIMYCVGSMPWYLDSRRSS